MSDTDGKPARNSQKSHKGRKSSRTGSAKQDGGAHATIKTNTGKTAISEDKSADNDDHVFSEEESEDELTCKLCQVVFTQKTDKLVECEKCDRWECQQCAELTNKQYDALQSAGEKMHWYCQGCNPEAMSAVKTAELVKNKCQQYVAELKVELIDLIDNKIGEKFEKTQEITDELRLELDNIKGKMKTQTSRNTADKQELKEEIGHELASTNLKEMELRESKKLNIIFFNVEESTSGNKEDAMREDDEKLDQLQQELNTSATLSNIIRLGTRNPDKPRPIKATVENLSEHRKILKAAKSLRLSADNSHVYVSRDLTPLEREAWRKLVLERKERQEESKRNQENVRWVIYRGKVVQGRPMEPPEEEEE